MKDITGIRLEVFADPSLPAKGPGRSPNGNFVLSEFKVRFAKLRGQGSAEASHADSTARRRFRRINSR